MIHWEVQEGFFAVRILSLSAAMRSAPLLRGWLQRKTSSVQCYFSRQIWRTTSLDIIWSWTEVFRFGDQPCS